MKIIIGMDKIDLKKLDKYLNDEVFTRCAVLNENESYIEFEADSEEEIAYVIDLARYISSYTEIVLFDEDGDLINTSNLMSDKEKEYKLIIDEIKISKKYHSRISKINQKLKKYDLLKIFNPLYVISLVISSLLASLLIVYMILSLKITNIPLICMPIVLVFVVFISIIITKIIINHILSVELCDIKYKKVIEKCNLYQFKKPKKPSVNKKKTNFKQLLINIIGFTIVPTIIAGPLLIAFNHAVLGFVIVLVPWITLLLIKFLVSDKELNNVEHLVGELTNRVYKLDDKYEVIKYQITEKKNNNWLIEIGGYKKFDYNYMNMIDDKNELELIKGLSGTVKCDCNWEEFDAVITNSIVKILRNGYPKKDKLVAITKGFVDGFEEVVIMLKDDEEQ